MRNAQVHVVFGLTFRIPCPYTCMCQGPPLILMAFLFFPPSLFSSSPAQGFSRTTRATRSSFQPQVLLCAGVLPSFFSPWVWFSASFALPPHLDRCFSESMERTVTFRDWDARHNSGAPFIAFYIRVLVDRLRRAGDFLGGSRG